MKSIILAYVSTWHHMSFKNKLVKPTKFNVSINAKVTPNRTPTHEPFSSCPVMCRCTDTYSLNCGEFEPLRNFVLIGLHTASPSFQPFIVRTSSQYGFWSSLMAFLVLSDYYFTQALLYNVSAFGPGCFSYDVTSTRLSWSHPKHTFKILFAWYMCGLDHLI